MSETQFVLEQGYTRTAIKKALRGDIMSNFPIHQGQVSYCCVSQYTHPDAPNVILIREARSMMSAVRQFIDQKYAIPVFVKQEDGNCIYKGEFRAVRYSDDRDEVAPYTRKAYRADVVGILFLERS